ncbi:MAG TPA: response regulator [Candidatus Saccharimonadales bacterium]|nr:response regulator [Candidatus Saccharimonadales bacterium]
MAKVLVVEDYASLQKIYKTALAMQGHVVDVANNGDEALDYTGKKEYDVILLDMLMPQTDGLSFLKIFSVRHRDAKTKIIAFSNLTTSELASEARELGVSKYLAKPALTPKQVAAEIDAVLKDSN